MKKEALLDVKVCSWALNWSGWANPRENRQERTLLMMLSWKDQQLLVF